MTVDVWKPQSQSINHLFYCTMTTCRKSYESLWTTLLNDLIAFPSSTHWRLWRSGPNVLAVPSGYIERCDKQTSGQQHVWGKRWMGDGNPTIPVSQGHREVTSCLCRVLRPGWSWGRPELRWLPRQPLPPPGSSLQSHAAEKEAKTYQKSGNRKTNREGSDQVHINVDNFKNVHFVFPSSVISLQWTHFKMLISYGSVVVLIQMVSLVVKGCALKIC